MLKRTILAAFLLLTCGNVLSDNIGPYPCYTYSQSGAIQTLNTTPYCQVARNLVNCDANNTESELYYSFSGVNSMSPYDYEGIYNLGSIKGNKPQSILLPSNSGGSEQYFVWFANKETPLSPSMTGWLAQPGYDIDLTKSDTLYVSTQAAKNGQAYVSTTGCPISTVSPNGSGTISNAEAYKQQPQSRFILNKVQSPKR